MTWATADVSDIESIEVVVTLPDWIATGLQERANAQSTEAERISYIGRAFSFFAQRVDNDPAGALAATVQALDITGRETAPLVALKITVSPRDTFALLHALTVFQLNTDFAAFNAACTTFLLAYLWGNPPGGEA